MRRVAGKFAREVEPLFDAVKRIYQRRHALMDEDVVHRSTLIRFVLDEVDRLGYSGIVVDWPYVASRNISSLLPYQPRGGAESDYRTALSMSEESYERLDVFCSRVKRQYPKMKKNVYRAFGIRILLRAVLMMDNSIDITASFQDDPIITTEPLEGGSDGAGDGDSAS